MNKGFRTWHIAEGPWNTCEDVNSIWDEMSTHIQNVVIEVFEVTRENKCEPKDTWWWNNNVQKAIIEKKECYKRLCATIFHALRTAAWF
jgi:dsDNA-specific endonuclease/ATPase MutS2